MQVAVGEGEQHAVRAVGHALPGVSLHLLRRSPGGLLKR